MAKRNLSEMLDLEPSEDTSQKTEEAKQALSGQRSSSISDILAKGEAQRSAYAQQQQNYNKQQFGHNIAEQHQNNQENILQKHHFPYF